MPISQLLSYGNCRIYDTRQVGRRLPWPKENNPPLLPSDLAHGLSHLLFSQHLGVCLPPFFQRLRSVGRGHMLPRPLLWGRRPQVAWPGRPVRLLLLHSRIPLASSSSVSHAYVVALHLSDPLYPSSRLLYPLRPFHIGIASMARNQWEERRSNESFEQVGKAQWKETACWLSHLSWYYNFLITILKF